MLGKGGEPVTAEMPQLQRRYYQQGLSNGTESERNACWAMANIFSEFIDDVTFRMRYHYRVFQQSPPGKTTRGGSFSQKIESANPAQLS
jgi:hypothetical protein